MTRLLKARTRVHNMSSVYSVQCSLTSIPFRGLNHKLFACSHVFEHLSNSFFMPTPIPSRFPTTVLRQARVARGHSVTPGVAGQTMPTSNGPALAFSNYM